MNEVRQFDLVGKSSKSRRVEGSCTFLDFDVTAFLTPGELRRFRDQTGLETSPVTLVLPAHWQGQLPPSLGENQVVVAFLHGMAGGRTSWGIGQAGQGQRESLVLKTLHSLESLGKEAVGVVLAGLGRDGGTLDAAASRHGITPQQYSRQLEFVLRYLDLFRCGKIIGVGHSVGAAALWEFAASILSSIGSPVSTTVSRPNLSVVAISPVRAIADSKYLTLGCQIAGRGLHLLLRPLVRLWRLSSRRLLDFTAVASVLRGLARQGPFTGNLAGVKGLVLVGERDWVALAGLTAGLRRAGCKWPVAKLAGLGHDLLRHAATEEALLNYLPILL